MPNLLKVTCRSKLCKRILLLLSCLILATCNQPKPDRSYLEGVPCTAPCWQDITPGITDKTTAMSILSNPKLVLQDTINCQTRTDNPLKSDCLFRRASDQGASISFEKGIVRGISLNSENISLGEIISVLGLPDFIYAMYGSQTVDEGKCYRADIYYLRGIYLFVSGCEPIEFPLEVVSGNDLRVFSDMLVISVRFLPPSDDPETALFYRYGDSDIQRHVNNIQTWTGFGLYPLPSKE